jgi:hypothetical protein
LAKSLNFKVIKFSRLKLSLTPEDILNVSRERLKDVLAGATTPTVPNIRFGIFSLSIIIYQEMALYTPTIRTTYTQYNSNPFLLPEKCFVIFFQKSQCNSAETTGVTRMDEQKKKATT